MPRPPSTAPISASITPSRWASIRKSNWPSRSKPSSSNFSPDSKKPRVLSDAGLFYFTARGLTAEGVGIAHIGAVDTVPGCAGCRTGLLPWQTRGAAGAVPVVGQVVFNAVEGLAHITAAVVVAQRVGRRVIVVGVLRRIVGCAGVRLAPVSIFRLWVDHAAGHMA